MVPKFSILHIVVVQCTYLHTVSMKRDLYYSYLGTIIGGLIPPRILSDQVETYNRIRVKHIARIQELKLQKIRAVQKILDKNLPVN